MPALAATSAVAAVPARAKGGREGLVTAVAAGAFIAGALVPAALFIGAFLVALSVA